MDKHQPYREFEEDIPLPDQEKAWQLMKEKLEEDKKRRLLPPVILNCAGWGALFLLLMAGAWFIFKKDSSGMRAENTSVKKEVSTPAPVTPNQPQNPDKAPASITPGEPLTATPGIEDVPAENKPVISSEDAGDHFREINRGSKQDKQTAKSLNNTKKKNTIKQKKDQVNVNRKLGEERKKGEVNQVARVDKKEESDQYKSDAGPVKSRKDSITVKAEEQKKAKELADSTVKKDTVAVDSPEVLKKTKEQKERTFVFSAGLGLQQQVPFNGQSSVPYDYYGRKSSLSDYIPSVYARFEKKDKWFIMGEFRFGAPQSLKEFSFSRQTKFDTISNRLTTTTMKLKKTYYHQLPLSFNYYLKPGWSLGAGAIYSRFYGAVTEREVNNFDVQTQTSTVTKQIARVQHFTDSFLYKTQLHFLLQTDVQWKRFNLGLRYTKDLQPYIRYTQPDGRINEEKNASFQLILRYRLWDSE